MKKRKRGRPKGSKNKYSSSLPNNITCWYWVLSKPENVKAFMNRGNDKQKEEIKECLIYWKGSNWRFFEKINGEELLKKLRR